MLKNRKAIVVTIMCVVVCLAAGFLGSIFTRPNIDGWYASLNKPLYNPPNWIFAPVWTSLYILMGIALSLIVMTEKGAPGRKAGLIAFGSQLVLNVLWSLLFFGLHYTGLALIEIVLLWVMIVVCIIIFSSLRRVAALLMIPYLLWVSFATLLNYALHSLNS